MDATVGAVATAALSGVVSVTGVVVAWRKDRATAKERLQLDKSTQVNQASDMSYQHLMALVEQLQEQSETDRKRFTDSEAMLRTLREDYYKALEILDAGHDQHRADQRMISELKADIAHLKKKGN